MLRKYEWNMQDIWDTVKNKAMNHGCRRRSTEKTKGIDLFNRIIAENFPNLEKESSGCRKLIEHQAVRTQKETLLDIS
jgi:23S rRNA G2445 N2-methylase RlmL